MRLVTALALLLSAAPVLAQTPGSCALGTAAGTLDVSDVRARLFNTGSLFYSSTASAQYTVPQDFGTSPIFAAGIWVGGLIGGDLRAAGSRYAQFEFWPGPLNEDATLPNPTDCSAFDRIFVVSRADVLDYEATGTATPDLAEWPVALGAPVVDGDGVPGNYDLAGGDRPLVYGHQTAFWVMNDVGNEHNETDTEPIGLEVRVSAFSVADERAALYSGTFYRYELVNRNAAPFTEAHFGFFTDPDLGDAGDDYIGVDSTRSLAFTYNGTNDDDVYGSPPPAVGYDFLTGAASHTFFIGGGPPGTGDPATGAEYYNYLQGLWGNGTEITAFGLGYQTPGEVTPWAFYGDPEREEFWSEVNYDGEGTDNFTGDRRQVISTGAFTIPPGGTHTVDFAILFAAGANHLNSVTVLKAASDEVQALYDAGGLFVPFPPFEPEPLAAPGLLLPTNGAAILDEPVPFSWRPVEGATRYILEVTLDPSDGAPDFEEAQRFLVLGGRTTATPDLVFPPYLTLDFAWRVRAEGGPAQSPFSEVRSFTTFRTMPDFFAQGYGIIEVAYPGAEVCPPGIDDFGCRFFGGNTVWLDPNSTADYVVTTPGNNLGQIALYARIIEDDDFEMRFTEACATPGTCLAVYADVAPGIGDDEIASVPFELWNVGTDEPGDETRMIPILRAPDSAAVLVDWEDAFPTAQDVIAGEDTLALGVTHRVLWMMPDRPDGYDLFAAAADGFGGPGGTYDPDTDGDTQVDSVRIYSGFPDDPPDVRACRTQDYYIDFCYRDASNRFVVPVGGLAGMVLADLAGDGTTPPVGTLIRFHSPTVPVDTEDDAPGQPVAFALGAAYPNPFRSAATVPFAVAESGRVRLSVFDVLGRRVAVLADGEMAAGAHRATFDGNRLASGVYLVVLEADGQRQSQKVMLVR